MTESKKMYKAGSAEALNLFEDAFKLTIRTNKSDEYKEGVMAGIRKLIDGRTIKSPYNEGEAKDDAFYSGVAEGLEIAQNFLIGKPEVALRAAK